MTALPATIDDTVTLLRSTGYIAGRGCPWFQFRSRAMPIFDGADQCGAFSYVV